MAAIAHRRQATGVSVTTQSFSLRTSAGSLITCQLALEAVSALRRPLFTRDSKHLDPSATIKARV